MKREITLLLILVFNLSFFCFSQQKNEKNDINEILSLQPIPKQSKESRIIELLSVLMDEKNNFIYSKELKDGQFRLDYNPIGFDIIIFNNKNQKREKNKSLIKDVIKIKLTTNPSQKITNNSFYEIIDCHKYFTQNSTNYYASNSPQVFNYVPMLTDMKILYGVVPSNEPHKILNRERTRYNLIHNGIPSDMYSGGTLDGVVIPEFYNGGDHSKLFTVDECWSRLIFSNKDFQLIGSDYFRSRDYAYGGELYYYGPTGITYGPKDENGYRRIIIAEFGRNRIKCDGYKYPGDESWVGKWHTIPGVVYGPYDISHHEGSSFYTQNDDVLWYTERGIIRRISCLKYNDPGYIVTTFNKYFAGEFIRTVDATRIDAYQENWYGCTNRSLLAFVNINSNSIALIHLKNQGFLPENDPPRAFSEIVFPEGETPTSVKFVTDVQGSYTNPVSVLISSNDQNGNGHLHKYKIVFSPYDNWGTPVYTEYIGSSYAPYESPNYNTTFKNIDNLEAQNGYADIFTYENWNDQYGIRRIKQGVCMIQNVWGDQYYKKNGTTWYLRIAGPVKAIVKGYLKINSSYYSQWSTYLNGVLVNDNQSNNSITLTSGTSFYRITMPFPTGIMVSNVRITVSMYPIDEQNGSANSQYIEKIYYPQSDPPGGCPFLYTLIDSNIFEIDNNILYKSELENNIGQDITDLPPIFSTHRRA